MSMSPEVEEFFNKFHDPRTGRFAPGGRTYSRSFKGFRAKSRDRREAADRLIARHQKKVDAATAQVQKWNARVPGRMVALQFSMSDRLRAFLDSL